MNNKNIGNEPFGVGILVIGTLDEFASLSLTTFRNLEITRICYVADDLGEDWLLANKTKLSGVTFCRHKNKEIISEISYLGEPSTYESFGTQKFFTLMILKWLLLLDIWQMHSEIERVMFSDLDVAWKRQPKVQDLLPQGSRYILAIQDDSTPKGRTFYCPGIMIWNRSQISKQIIRDIYDFQRQEIRSSKIIADDKALNYFIQTNNLHSLVRLLDQKSYVIGHRFPYLMAGINGFSLRRYYAFHANYVSGSKMKLLYLKFSLVHPANPLRYWYVFWFIWNKLMMRLK
jgi:hypothetical protein